MSAQEHLTYDELKTALELRALIQKISEVPPDLQGACGVLSKTMVHLFGWGLQVGEFRGDSHAWNLVRGKIVDLTATQFDIPEEIWVTDENDPDYYPEWSSFGAARQLKEWDSCHPKWGTLEREMDALLQKLYMTRAFAETLRRSRIATADPGTSPQNPAGESESSRSSGTPP